MAIAVIGGAAALVGTGISTYEGLHQEHQANEIQKNLKDPIFNIPPEFEQNRQIARQMAQLGLPQQQYNNAVNNIGQSQAAGLATLSQSANPGAGVASVVRQGNAAKANLDASDATARENNQRFFIDQNKQYAGQELAKQQSDTFDKYTRDFNQMQALRGAGMQNLNTAAGDLSKLGMTGLQYASDNPGTGFTNPANAPLSASGTGIATPPLNYNPQTLPYYQIPG